MHGEYEPPGSKLVTAVVEVTAAPWPRPGQRRLAAGYGEALERISAAATGLPAGAGTAAIAEIIEAALGGDAEPAGLCPGALAVAIRRAVLRASDWRDQD